MAGHLAALGEAVTGLGTRITVHHKVLEELADALPGGRERMQASIQRAEAEEAEKVQEARREAERVRVEEEERRKQEADREAEAAAAARAEETVLPEATADAGDADMDMAAENGAGAAAAETYAPGSPASAPGFSGATNSAGAGGLSPAATL